MTKPACARYVGYRFPAQTIGYAVWLYFRFPLGLRMVEELLAARGIIVSHEPCGSGRANLANDDIGEQNVKNIVQPVHAYAMSAAGVASLPQVIARAQPSAPPRRNSLRLAIIAASLATVIGRDRDLVELAQSESVGYRGPGTHGRKRAKTVCR